MLTGVYEKKGFTSASSLENLKKKKKKKFVSFCGMYLKKS